MYNSTYFDCGSRAANYIFKLVAFFSLDWDNVYCRIMYRDHIILPILTIYTVPQKQPTGCTQPWSKGQWEMRCTGAIKLPQLPKALHVIIRGGSVKWYGDKVSGGEHTALHNDVSIPLTSLCYSTISLSWEIYQYSYSSFLIKKKRLGVCLSSVSTWVPYWSVEALEYGGNKATNVSFLWDAYRSLHTQYGPSNSWFLFLSICFPFAESLSHFSSVLVIIFLSLFFCTSIFYHWPGIS